MRSRTTRLFGVILVLVSPAVASAAGPYETHVVAPPWQHEAAHDRAADATVVLPSKTHVSPDTSDVLREIPALRLRQTGGLGGMVTAHIRGSSAEQVNLFWNGVPLHQLALGSFDLSMLPAANDARIEVYRGTSPLEFGQGNIAGTIAIQSGVPNQSQGVGQVGIGSFSTAQASVRGAYVHDRWLATAAAAAQTSAGDFTFDSDAATAFASTPTRAEQRRNNDFSDLNVQTRLRYRTPLGRKLEMFAWGYGREGGLPGPATLPQIGVRRASRHEVVTLRYISHADLPAPSRVRAQVYVARNTQDLSDPNGDTAGYPLTRRAQAHTLGTTQVARWAWGRHLRLSAMGQAQFDTYRTLETRREPTISAERWNAGLGAQGDASLWADTLHVIPTVRLDAARDVQPGRAVATYVPGMRLGLLKHIGVPWVVRANVSRDGRLATPYERWGDAGRVLPNLELRPERAWGADIGGQGAWEVGPWAWRLESTAFATWSDDLIAFARSSMGQARAYNLGRGRVRGIDAGLNVRYRARFEATAHVTWLDARDTSDSPAGRNRNRLPMRPSWQAFIRPQVCMPLAHGWAVRSYAEVDANSDSYLDPANLARTPERFFLHAGLQLQGMQDRVLITLAGRNLTDARAFDVAGYPMTSRGVMVTTRIYTAGAS